MAQIQSKTSLLLANYKVKLHVGLEYPYALASYTPKSFWSQVIFPLLEGSTPSVC